MTVQADQLVLQDVVVSFGALQAVAGVSLRVPAGQRRAVIGANGAGKTTLFNAITGVIMPTAGRVVFEGRTITRWAPHARAKIGISRTFQITNLFADLTVAENIMLALRGLGWRKFSIFGSAAMTAEEQHKAQRALAFARLTDRLATRVKHLSYGEQRQLELALALVTEPKILLLDEPAAGLSPSERGLVADIIKELPRTITLVLIEHDMDLALGLVDFVTCMYEGKILVESTPDLIRSNAAVQEVYLGKPRHA